MQYSYNLFLPAKTLMLLRSLSGRYEFAASLRRILWQKDVEEVYTIRSNEWGLIPRVKVVDSAILCPIPELSVVLSN